MSNNEFEATYDPQFPNDANPKLQTTSLGSFYSFLINELEINLSTNLSDDLKNVIKQNLNDYEQFNFRKWEEKDFVINQLKQNLVDLTEKRFRTSQANANQTAPLNNENIEFLLNEKEAKIRDIQAELNDKENEILRLKQTIKDQDNVILSHNNNIHEIKNNNQTVLKAKQESFRMMNEDLMNKQKQIEDQTNLIKDLRDKIEVLEESHEKSRLDLEKRLNEKENDLQVKIAHFEANLHEGKHYFEDILSERAVEINKLKQKLSKYEPTGTNELESNTSVESINLEDSSILLSSSLINLDSENLKSIKSLYEHQIELLKVKIEMLEKTCSNYQQGIKEMNKNFGLKQQSDEANSIQIFKDLMQDLQKANVQLETEKIDLEVRVAKLQSDLDQTRNEKENLNKKFTNTDNLNQKLLNERAEFEAYYRTQLEVKTSELADLGQQLFTLRVEYERLRDDNIHLVQISLEHEQLKITNAELTQHYEQLYQQATDIVNGNQILNDQVQTSNENILNLEAQISELNLKVEHLSNCNSDLNTQKINSEMKVQILEENLTKISPDLAELANLRSMKLDTEKLNEKIKDLNVELEEKNELVEQLNQAKEFLAENNSKLLTNNIKIQLFIESLGLDQSEIESNHKVKEYDELIERLKLTELELITLKTLNHELEANYFDLKSKIKNQIEKKDQEILDLNQKLIELGSNVTNQVQVDAEVQCDELANQLNILELQNQLSSAKESQLGDVKSKLDELTTKFSTTEKQNLKLKAKLKQLLNAGKDQAKAIQEHMLAQTDLSLADMDSIYEKLSCLEKELADKRVEIKNLSESNSGLGFLVQFGANIASEQINARTISDLKLLKQDLDILMLNNKIKYENLRSEYESLSAQKSADLDFKDQITNLEAQLNEKLNQINSISELLELKTNEFDSKNSYISILETQLSDLKKNKDFENKVEIKAENNWENSWDDELVLKKEQIFSLETQLNEKINEISSLSSICEDLKLKIKTESESNTDKNALLDEVNTKSVYISNLESQLAEKQTEIDSIKESLSIKNIELEELRQDQLLDEKQNEINTVKEAFDAKTREFDQLTELTNEHRNQEIMLKDSQILELQAQLDSCKTDLQNLSVANNNNYKLRTQEFESLKIDLETKENHIFVLKESEKKNIEDLEAWKKKYDSMRLKALAMKDKIKKIELSNGGENSPGTSARSSLESSNLAEHLFHNLQDEYNEFKRNHLVEIQEIHKSYLEQLKGYESNFERVQNENEALSEDLNGLKSKQADLEQLKEKFEDLSTKLIQTEKQNLKLKVKLKQLLAKQQEVQLNEIPKESSLLLTTSAPDEHILRPVTPLSMLHHSPAVIETCMAQTQTDLDQETVQRLTEEYECKIQDLEAKLTANDSRATELVELKEKLKTTQEQNLKLKAKLKQLIASNRSKQSSEHSNHPASFDSETQTDLEEENSFKVEQNEILGNYESKLNELNQENLCLKNEIKKEIDSKLNLINELESEKKSILCQKDELEIKSNKLVEDLSRKELDIESVQKKVQEYQNLIDLKQQMNDGLMHQSTELKQMVEQQREKYEQQLNNLHSVLSQKETCLIELNNQLLNLKSQQNFLNVSISNHVDANEVVVDDNLKASSCVSNSNTNLESQLKYCHEKCENVVLKLTQLKKQNESLNNKIKSIKSMIFA